MTAPAGIIKKTKDNSNKKYRENSEWQKGKRLGRPKQVWVYDELERGASATSDTPGHWEKV